MSTSGDRAATDPATLLTEYATAVRDAFDIPLAVPDQIGEEDKLWRRRAIAVDGAANVILGCGDDTEAVAREIEYLRVRIAELPVTYSRFTTPAADGSGVCDVHGSEEPCGSPVPATRLGSGPHSGEMAVTTR